MIQENAYDFRKRLLQVHRLKLADISRAPGTNDLVLKNGLIIEIGAHASPVIQTAAEDFVDFLPKNT